MQYATLENILASTRRIPFVNEDGLLLRDYLGVAARNGLDVKLDVYREDDLKEMFREGVIVLKSLHLQRRFLFVKADAGRGFFGGQKTNVLSYLGDFVGGGYAPGPILRSLAVALTSINNAYRSSGFLRGSAL